MFFLLQTLWLNFLSASLQHGSCSSCNQTDHVSSNAWDEGNEGKTGRSSDKPIACLILTRFERVMSEEFPSRGSVPCFVWHKLCDVSMIIQIRSWYWHLGTYVCMRWWWCNEAVETLSLAWIFFCTTEGLTEKRNCNPYNCRTRFQYRDTILHRSRHTRSRVWKFGCLMWFSRENLK